MERLGKCPTHREIANTYYIKTYAKRNIQKLLVLHTPTHRKLIIIYTYTVYMIWTHFLQNARGSTVAEIYK